MTTRQGHFMPPALLDSQFAALEEPQTNDNVIVVDTARPPSEIVGDILGKLKGRGAGV